MIVVPINYLTVVAAAVVSMVLGFLWYGPFFGKLWLKLMNFTPEKMASARAQGMGKSYALMTLGSLVMSYILAHAVIFANAYLKMGGVSAGLMVGALNWLGFIAPVTLGTVLWEGKPWQLWWLNSAYYLVALLLMGAILSTWQ